MGLSIFLAGRGGFPRDLLRLFDISLHLEWVYKQDFGPNYSYVACSCLLIPNHFLIFQGDSEDEMTDEALSSPGERQCANPIKSVQSYCGVVSSNI